MKVLKILGSVIVIALCLTLVGFAGFFLWSALPRERPEPAVLSTEQLFQAQEEETDGGLPEEPGLICYGDSMENSAQHCLDELLSRDCDAIVVCQGLMASETVVYLNKKGIQPGKGIDLVSFVDYDSNFDQLYSNQMDRIIQPVEELGAAAGEQILKRIEKPDAPIFEKVLTSAYKPYDIPSSWLHSDR